MQVHLQGKVAIVTGASSGVGLATTREFLDADIRGIVAVDLRENASTELAQILERHSGKAIYLGGDVCLQGTAERFTNVAMERFGRIDVMLNNAGVSVVKPIHEHTEADWDFVMDTNVKALYWAAKYVVPIMTQQGSGLILNTGSISGHVGINGQGAYGPSKGAVHQMTKQMAIEYAKHGIRVNSVALGTVDTPIVQWSAQQTSNPQAFIEGLKQKHPIGRIATAEEAAKFFTYLASDHATFFTGAILSMDGGFTAH